MKYTDNKGRVVTVNDIDNNMAELNNGERVAVSRLKDTRYYTPMNESVVESNSSNNSVNNTNQVPANIMENSNSRYENILNNMNSGQKQSSDSSYNISIGEEGYVDENSNYGNQRWNANSEIRMSNDVVERREPKQPPKQPPNKTSKQNAPSSSEEDLLRKYNYPAPEENKDDTLKELAYGKENVESTKDVSESEPKKVEENAVHQMFDKAKKVHPLKVDLKINEKIPSKDIIKMMEENFEDSAIEYYAKDIFKTLMNDPSIIENQIKKSIDKYVNGNAKKKTTKKKASKKKTKKDDK